MIKSLNILVIIFSCSLALGQELESVVVQTWSHNEPPTESGPHILEIKYNRNKHGDFEAKSYTVTSGKSKKFKLNGTKRLQKEDVSTFLAWLDTSKTTFKLSELETNLVELGKSISNAPYKPELPIGDDFLVKIDSFYYCNEYQFKKSISSGGYTIKVLLINDNQKTEFFSYDSDDRGQYKFDLKGYLYLQPMLENKIPEELRVEDFFSKKTLLSNLLYYKKVTECEGFYYQEFIKANPERSVQQNRMMVGWDFEKYLNKRNEK